jgi:hypothetical protein
MLSSTSEVANHHKDAADVAEFYFPARRRVRPCPVCAGATERVRRRPIDRLQSMFRPVHRYRCLEADCHWEGNLHVISVIDANVGS